MVSIPCLSVLINTVNSADTWFGARVKDLYRPANIWAEARCHFDKKKVGNPGNTETTSKGDQSQVKLFSEIGFLWICCSLFSKRESYVCLFHTISSICQNQTRQTYLWTKIPNQLQNGNWKLKADYLMRFNIQHNALIHKYWPCNLYFRVELDQRPE